MRKSSKALIFINDVSIGPSLLLSHENTGKLGLFGGRGKNDESSQDCLKRELQEELGETVQVRNIEEIKEFCRSGVKYTLFGVGVHGRVELQDKEIAGGVLYPLAPEFKLQRNLFKTRITNSLKLTLNKQQKRKKLIQLSQKPGFSSNLKFPSNKLLRLV